MHHCQLINRPQKGVIVVLKLILYYIKGYVIISITGFGAMRFVNMTSHRGLYLWDIKEKSPGVIEGKISIKDFKNIKPIIKKTKCKIKVIKKIGLPFFFYRYRKRKVLFLGALFFVMSLYILSLFVWRIEILGYERIDYEELRLFAAEQGLEIGSIKTNIDRLALEKNMLYNFPDIAYINIDIRGTRAILHIAETLPKVQIADNTTPTDIIAKKDAIIENISVSTGVPMVRPGDIVAPGDILVSGRVISTDDMGIEHIEYITAAAVVEGRIFKKIEFDIEKEYQEKFFTGVNTRRFSVNIADFVFNFFNQNNIGKKFVNYDIITSRVQLSFGADYPMPFIFLTHTIREYSYREIERSVVQMEELALIKTTNAILNNLDFGTDVLEKNIQTKITDNGLSVEVLVVTLEDIGETIKIENSN